MKARLVYIFAAIGAALAAAVGWLLSSEYRRRRQSKAMQEREKCLADAAKAADEVIDEIDSAHSDDGGARIAAKARFILDTLEGRVSDR